MKGVTQMKRNFRVIVLAFVLSFFAFSLAAAAGADYSPVPKSASMFASVAIKGHLKELMVKAKDLLIDRPEFKAMVEEFTKETKVPFPSELFDYSKNIAAVRCALFPYPAAEKKDPDVLISVVFDSEKTAAEFYAKLNAKVAEIAKTPDAKTVINVAEEQGLSVITVDSSSEKHKDAELKFFLSGASFCFVAHEKNSANFKSILAAAKDPKEGITAAAKFKSFTEAAAGPASFVVFLDTAALKGDPDKSAAEMAEGLGSVGLVADFTEDLSKISFTCVMATTPEGIADKKVAEGFKIFKTLFGGKKSDSKPAAILPADIAGFFDIKLNIAKELLDQEIFGQARTGLQMMFGVNIEQDILTWFDGEIFAAVGEIAGLAEMQKSMEAPEAYFALHFTNAEKAGAFFDKVEAIIKKASEGKIEIAAEKAGDINVRSIKVQSPVKNLGLTLGPVGDYMVLASTKAAFEKAAAAKNKPETSLASYKEFGAVSAVLSPSAVTNYKNVEKSAKLAKEIYPALAAEMPFDVFKTSAASINLVNDNVVISAAVSTDPTKINAEKIWARIMKLKDMMSGKKSEAPAEKPEAKEEKGEKTE